MKFLRFVVYLTMIVIVLGSVIVANQIYENEKILFQEKAEDRIYEENKALVKYQESLEKKELNDLRLRQNEAYLSCMNTPYKSLNTESRIQKLLLEYQDEPISFSFYDVKNDYSILKDVNDSYYGASIIKLLESLYLVNKAMSGEISLSETVVYQKKHISDYSLEMEKYSLGDSVSLENLIRYAISVSDNTAHEMLYDYIGVDNLKSYASYLGISLSIDQVEHFGYLTASDGMKILQEAYRVLRLQNFYSDLLRDSMNNSYYNSFNFSDVTFLHKYGFTVPYYNEIGIYYSKNPYLLSLFTLNASDEDYFRKVNLFSQKIYEIYEKNLEDKDEHCILIKNATI